MCVIAGTWTIHSLGTSECREVEFLDNNRYREEGSTMEYRWEYDDTKSTIVRYDTPEMKVEAQAVWSGSDILCLVSMGKPVEVWVRRTPADGRERQNSARKKLKKMHDRAMAKLDKMRVTTTEDLLNRYSAGEMEFLGSLRNARLAGAYLPYVNFPDGRTDLSHADLSGANLFEADLCRVNLRTADLDRADLRGAGMRGAKLSCASLNYANLGPGLRPVTLVNADFRGADLTGACLIRADLRDADLSRANLSGANISDADLLNANLDGANLEDTVLNNANLHGVDLSRVILAEEQREQTKMIDTSQNLSPDNPHWKPGRSWPRFPPPLPPTTAGQT